MSRIIKFRAWDEDRKIMITDFSIIDFSKNNYRLLQKDNEGDDDYGSFFCGGYMSNSDWQEPVLMQYTGLKDKNGKEIYEGDIVQDDKEMGVVYFYSPQFIVQCLRNNETPDGVYALAKGKVNVTELIETEVIGNIYENPELLNTTVQ